MEMNLVNEQFKLKFEEYKSRLTLKELNKMPYLENVAYFFFLAGFIKGSGNNQLTC